MVREILDDTAVQGSAEWLEARLGFRNASETPDVMGVGFNTPNKLKRIKAGLETVFVNAAMKRGSELEDQVREWAENELGEMFSSSVWENEEYRASLDGLSFDQSTLIEIKVSDFTFQKVWDGDIPENYRLQMLHQMYCSPAAKGYLVAYSPTNDEYIISESIEFDESKWAEIHKAWDVFDKMEVPDEEFIELNNEKYDALDAEYADVKFEMDKLAAQLKETKAEMEIIADGRNIKALFTKLNFATKKGAVDYKKILKENGIKVDEDTFRKPSTTYATVRINKK